MIGDLSDVDIDSRILVILFVGNFADLLTEGANCINIEHGVNVLYSDCKALKTHSGINILLLQSCIVAVTVVLELCENVVPDFHETVAVASRLGVIFICHIFFAAVIVDFRTRTAGACSVLPEIVFLAELVDAVLRNTDLISPDSQSLIVFEVDRRVQSVRVKAYDICQEFPCPVDRFSLEIVTE